MTKAEAALEWARERISAGTYKTIGAALNGATPKYVSIDKLDGIYRVYYFADKSYIMTYINPRQQEAWIPNMRP